MAAFGTLAVANIGDARDRMGMLDAGIRATWRGARLVGRARTVWTRPGDNLAIHQVLPHCRPGDVLVINGGGDTTRALIGELIAEKAKARGVVGMIIDGVVRDGVELERIGFPVWSRGLCPAGPYKNGPGKLDVPVAVGGVAVCPGDLVVADDDGVIVIPAAEAAASLLAGARSRPTRRSAAPRSWPGCVMIAVWALVAFVAVIIVWNAVFKRNIGEAMIVGFLAVCGFALFGGVALGDIGEAVLDSMQEEVTFAGLAFVFMSYLLVKTPVLDKLIDLLNSVLGRLRGGPSTPPPSPAASSARSPTSGRPSPPRSARSPCRG